jgi:threonine dehydratase
MEILRAKNGQPLDAIFCCVGGGGLIAGVAAYVKAVRPSVKVSRRPSRWLLDGKECSRAPS